MSSTIPTLRFSGFDEPWDTKKLKDYGVSVIDGDRGKNYPNGDDFTPEGFCVFLSAKNVTKSGFDFREVMFISDKKDKSLSKGKLVPDDVVLTTRGTVGNIALFDSSVAHTHLRINSGMVLLRATKSELSPRFLYSAFFAPPLDSEVKKTAFGSAQPQLTVKGIYALKFGAPTLPEQRKIADFLTAVDGRIQQLIQKKALLEDYKKGVMQQLFTQAIRFKDEDGNDFPDWEEKPLGGVATLINGRAYKQKELLREGPYPVLRVGNFFSNPEWYYSDIELPEDKYCDTGDLLYAWSASFGPRIWRGGKVIYHYHIWKVKTSELVDQNYLFHFMDWDTDQIKRAQSSGAIMLHVTKQSMEERSMPLPSVPEQTKIANFLSALDSKIEIVTTQITETQTFKRGLLQQMFV